MWMKEMILQILILMLRWSVAIIELCILKIWHCSFNIICMTMYLFARSKKSSYANVILCHFTSINQLQCIGQPVMLPAS